MSYSENINYWFLETMPNKLQDLADTASSSPEGMSLPQWKELLERIVFLLREANLETCVKYHSELERGEAALSTELRNEISEYVDACKTEGLDLFNKYFWYLDD